MASTPQREPADVLAVLDSVTEAFEEPPDVSVEDGGRFGERFMAEFRHRDERRVGDAAVKVLGNVDR